MQKNKKKKRRKKMSKSIYDEALEKINVEFDAWDRAEHLELFELVEQALKQAEKQEKLLELYKKLNRTTFGKELLEIQEQIKELENE